MTRAADSPSLFATFTVLTVIGWAVWRAFLSRYDWLHPHDCRYELFEDDRQQEATSRRIRRRHNRVRQVSQR